MIIEKIIKKPKKSLSQNFINDKNICNKIIEQTTIKNKNILEIGPGYGFLTDIILKQNPKNIYLIEKDNNLSLYLNNNYKNIKNIHIFNNDILNFNFAKFNNINVVSNLPYNISSKIIINLFQYKKIIFEMIFMIQKEMALKFDYNIPKLNKYKFFNKLSCEYKRCFDVPSTVFYPKPKINSSVVKFNFKNCKIDWDKANDFANKIFKNKRKKIYNNIKIDTNDYYIKKIMDKRVDKIEIDDLLKIYNFF